MTTYTFETMTQSDAAAFTSLDSLRFFNTAVKSLNIVDNPSTALTAESLTVSTGTQSLTFSAGALSIASTTLNGVAFLNGDVLQVGTNASDSGLTASSGVAGKGAELWGFGGADTLNGGAASDTILGGEGNDVITGSSAAGSATESDYLFGGNGNDVITGGNGNDHIYGNALTSAQGANDGDDNIHAGAGNDYVNGNAGNDTIDGETGNDVLYGGSGNDLIIGGNTDAGLDYLQGNKGNDTLYGGDGNDVLHGGADNDLVDGGNGNDQVFGDNGNDTVTGGAGYDVITGGAGNDVFSFVAGDANNANLTSAATAAGHGVVDQITDFTHGADHIALSFTGVAASVIYQQAGVTFTSADAALNYAQGLITQDFTANPTHVHDVAAITVGSDTYLFFAGAAAGGSTIDSAIKLVGITASATTFSSSDIV